MLTERKSDLKINLRKGWNSYAALENRAKEESRAILDNWYAYDSSFGNYVATLKDIIGRVDFKDFISTHEPFVAVDLMSSTKALRSLFSRAPYEHEKIGVAVSMWDIRTDQDKSEDDNLGIKQIGGDLTRSSTWRQINTDLEGRKANLVIERGLGGLQNVPSNPLFYGVIINRIWSLLDPNGGMFIGQLPAEGTMLFSGVNLYEWAMQLRETGIEFDYKYYTSTDIGRGTGALKLVRKPTDPQRLPMLE